MLRNPAPREPQRGLQEEACLHRGARPLPHCLSESGEVNQQRTQETHTLQNAGLGKRRVTLTCALNIRKLKFDADVGKGGERMCFNGARNSAQHAHHTLMAGRERDGEGTPIPINHGSLEPVPVPACTRSPH